MQDSSNSEKIREHGQIETILEIGADGGGISIVRDTWLPEDEPAFYCEQSEYYELNDEDGGNISSNYRSRFFKTWIDALMATKVSRYWWELYCVQVHPDFKDEVLTLVSAFGGPRSREKWIESQGFEALSLPQSAGQGFRTRTS